LFHGISDTKGQRHEHEVQAMDIKNLIGKLKSELKLRHFDDTLAADTFRSIGGVYWKMMDTPSKVSYLRLQLKLVEDHPDADPHVGVMELPNGLTDDSFQQTVIGSSVQWVEQVSKFLSQAYLDAKWLNFPRSLLDDIEINKGHYTYEELIQSLAIYQNNVEVDGSRASRYNKDGTPKIVPISEEAKAISFAYYDQIAFGIEHIASLEPEEQHELIRQGVISSSNVGYPFFVSQSKENIFKLWRKFLNDFLHLNAFNDREFVTVEEIFSVVKFCINKKFHFPYALFYRTQVRKVRAVFGGHIVDKMIGALIHSAKEFGLTQDAVHKLNIHTTDEEYYYDHHGNLIGDKMTMLPGKGKLPYIAQLPWEILFKIIHDQLPPIGEELTSQEIRDKYDYNDLPEGDYLVNVVGEDFSKYDTTIIPEDLEWLRGHKKLGWLIGYILDDLINSDVWTGNLRVKDVYFKSGHPFTSNLGTDIHTQRQFAYAEQSDETHILTFTNLSDDSLEYTIGFDMIEFNKWLNDFGLQVKVEESFDYQRDRIGIFLKTLFGEVLKGGSLGILGEPQSKYLGICHSEREITPENVDRDVGVWNITGNIQVDMALSKLASLGPTGQSLIMVFLNLVKGTRFGRDLILAISEIDTSRVYKLYREDVAASLSDPAWLGNMPVLNLLVRESE
jgi:hypothetical protein